MIELERGTGSRRGLWLIAICITVLVTSPGMLRAAVLDDVQLDAYAGKVVVLDFWASWCVPCRRSFPWLNSMRDKYAEQGLVIIGVNLDLERAEADRFLREYPPKFNIYFDKQQALAQQYEVIAMPSSYVIGRDGTIVARHLGFKVKHEADYEAVIESALQQGVPGDE